MWPQLLGLLMFMLLFFVCLFVFFLGGGGFAQVIFKGENAADLLI